MEYLGIKIKERVTEYHYYPSYIMCPADTVDKQMECLYYEPKRDLTCKYSPDDDSCMYKHSKDKEQ
jgi:hypothetical protein